MTTIWWFMLNYVIILSPGRVTRKFSCSGVLVVVEGSGTNCGAQCNVPTVRYLAIHVRTYHLECTKCRLYKFMVLAVTCHF